MLLLSVPYVSSEKPPLTLVDSIQSYRLQSHLGQNFVDYVLDPENTWTFPEISSPSSEAVFLDSLDMVPGYRSLDGSIWIRFRVNDRTTEHRKWHIITNRNRTFLLNQIMHFGLWPNAELATQSPSISLYLPVPEDPRPTDVVRTVDGSVYEKRSAPFTDVFSSRDLPHRFFVFAIPDDVDWARPVYMQFNHENIFSSYLRIESLRSIYAEHRQIQIEFGVFYGLVIGLVSYNLFLFFSLRDRSYLFYVLYMVSLTVFISIYLGNAFEYLWPDSPIWDRASMYVFVGLMLTFAALFTRSFLRSSTLSPRFDRGLLVVAGLGLLTGAFGYFSANLGDRLSYLTAMILIPIAIGAGVRSLRNGFGPARYYLVAWGGLLGSSIIYMGMALGLIPPGEWSTPGVLKLSVSCEAILFALGLASRVKVLDKERLEATHAAERLETELETAKEMQMSLMSGTAPAVAGIDLAGQCIPATSVGGDFFRYAETDRGVFVSLADVTGHAMKAAIPAALFSGMLERELRHGAHLDELYAALNLSLTESLDKRTFVCFAACLIDPESLRLQLSNGGCPYPYHYSAATGTLHELTIDAYPLGVAANTVYEIKSISLAPGDYVVFCSDGLPEIENPESEVLGYDETALIVQDACESGLSAERTIELILTRILDFKRDTDQIDDVTCVVLRIEGSEG